MRSICVDGFNLGLSKGTGIATYGRNLLSTARDIGLETQALFGPETAATGKAVLNEAAIAGATRSRRLRPSERVARGALTFLSQFGRTAHSTRPTGEVLWPTERQAPPADILWSARDLYTRARRCYRLHDRFTPVRFEDGLAEAPSMMHWTAPLPLFAPGRPNIYTIHDLIPLRLPHTTLHDRQAFMKLHEAVVRRADRILVVSETTREDVVRLLNVEEDRVVNTYQAVSLPDELTQRPDAAVAEEIERIFGLEWKGYFLNFGAIEPKKNLGRLTEAYLTSGSLTPLVQIGAPGWLHESETALLEQVARDRRPVADRIRRYEYTSLPLLISLIRGARAVLFPSLYEGFGLPVLEAMTLSTAVLTSNAGALAEVAGDAALLVDPYDVQSIATGIRSLDADPDLVADLESRGRAQASRFTPDLYRERLARAYTI